MIHSDHAWDDPVPWYFDPGIMKLEQQSVVRKNLQVVGRADQALDKGSSLLLTLRTSPRVSRVADDGQCGPSTNVAGITQAAVVTEAQGAQKQFVCPYHG